MRLGPRSEVAISWENANPAASTKISRIGKKPVPSDGGNAGAAGEDAAAAAASARIGNIDALSRCPSDQAGITGDSGSIPYYGARPREPRSIVKKFPKCPPHDGARPPAASAFNRHRPARAGRRVERRQRPHVRQAVLSGCIDARLV